MPDRLTPDAVAFTGALTFSDLPADVVDAAKRCLVDGVGVAVAGLETEVARQVRGYALSEGLAGSCRLIGDTGGRVPVSKAALYLGTCGNAMDWDDVQLPEGAARPFGLLMHGTTPVLATVVALTDLVSHQHNRTVSGEDFVTAFVAGWEVAGNLASTVTPGHYHNGFHTSGTIGTFGCAMAAGKLLGLNTDQLTWSLGHAASMAAGIQASMGTMTKPMQAGWCAARGIEAALLAKSGVSGPDDALDGPRGYLTTTSPEVHVDRVLGRFGDPFVLASPGVSAKPYPCGAVTHPGMYALRQVMTDNALTADHIKQIEVSAPAALWHLISYPFAGTVHHAKYCFPFLLAAIALKGTAGRAEFTDAFIRSTACVAFQNKVTIRTDESLEDENDDILASRLVIETADGRVFDADGPADYPGGPRLPLDDTAVDEKYNAATAGLLPRDRATALHTVLRTFETQPDARILLDTLGNVTVPDP